MKWTGYVVWRLIIMSSVFVLLCDPVSTKISKTRTSRKEHKKRHQSNYKFNLRKVYVRRAKAMNATCLGKFISHFNIFLWFRMYIEITIALLPISTFTKDQIGLLLNPSKCINCTFDIISHHRTRKPIPFVLKALTRDNNFFRINVRCCCVKPFRIRIYYFIFKTTTQHKYVLM